MKKSIIIIASFVLIACSLSAQSVKRYVSLYSGIQNPSEFVLFNVGSREGLIDVFEAGPEIGLSSEMHSERIGIQFSTSYLRNGLKNTDQRTFYGNLNSSHSKFLTTLRLISKGKSQLRIGVGVGIILSRSPKLNVQLYPSDYGIENGFESERDYDVFWGRSYSLAGSIRYQYEVNEKWSLFVAANRDVVIDYGGIEDAILLSGNMGVSYLFQEK